MIEQDVYRPRRDDDHPKPPAWIFATLRLVVVVAVLYAILFVSVRVAYDRGVRAGSHTISSTR